MRTFSHMKQGETCHHQMKPQEPRYQTYHKFTSLTDLKRHHQTAQMEEAANGLV